MNTMPRITITDIYGRICVSAGLDVIPLREDAVRAKIKEYYGNQTICSFKYNAIEKLLRQQILTSLENNQLLNKEVSWNCVPPDIQQLLCDSGGFCVFKAIINK